MMLNGNETRYYARGNLIVRGVALLLGLCMVFSIIKHKMSATVTQIDLSDSIIYGDVNDDGQVNIVDLIVLKKHLAFLPAKVNFTASDLTGDKNGLDADDVLVLQKVLLGNTVSINPTVIFLGDDFETPEESQAAWSGANFNIVTDSEDNTNHCLSPESNAVCRIANAKWTSTNRPTETTVKVKLNSNSDSLRLWLGYDRENEYGFGVRVAVERGYLLIAAATTGNNVSMAVPTNGGKLLGVLGTSDAMGNYAQCAYDRWITVHAEYEYFNWEQKVVKVIYTLTAPSYDATEQTYGDDVTISNFTVVYTLPQDVSEGLTFACFATGTVYLDDVQVSSVEGRETVTMQERAAAFQDDYAALLNKSFAQVSSADAAACREAVAAYRSLPFEAQQLLYAEKEKLFLFDSILTDNANTDFANENFESVSDYENRWQTEEMERGSNLLTAAQISDMHQSMKCKAAVHNGVPFITRVSDENWPLATKTLKTLNFSLDLATCGGWETSTRVALYYDPYTKQNIYLDYSLTDLTDGGGHRLIKPRLMCSSDITFTGGAYFDGTSSGFHFAETDQLDVTVTYTITNLHSLQILLSCTNGVSTVNAQRVFTRKAEAVSAFPIQDFRFGILSANNASTAVYIDNIAVTYENRSVPLAEDARDEYLADHADILAKTAANYVNASDRSALLAAKDAFDHYDVKTKTLLAGAGVTAKIGELLPLARKAYPDFNETFEDDLDKWRVGWQQATDAVVRICTSPTDQQNRVLNLYGKNGLMLPKAGYWSPDAAPTAISLDLYFERVNAFNPPTIYYSYTDTSNYYALRFGNNNNVQVIRMKKGVSSSSGWKSLPFTSQNSWLNVGFSFSEDTVRISIADLSGMTYSFTDSAAGSASRLGIGLGDSAGSATFDAPNIYVDNIVCELSGNEWDTDETIHDISVYYAGNTLLKAGETVTLSGENLAETVDKVLVARLPDETGNTPGFIAEDRYDSVAANRGISSAANPSSWSSLSGNAVEVPPIQKTESSLKFIIPPELAGKDGKGIYAVKLLPVYKDAADVVLYLNNPEISFIMGNDGETASAGGRFKIVGKNLVPTGNVSDIRIVLKNVANHNLLEIPTEEISVSSSDMYLLEASVLQGLTAGDYEVFVYNGYGDSTCWSEPSILKIAASPTDGWNQTVINVKDANYGAYGDGQHNDTPAIVKALSEIAGQGGGVLYLPSGVYRLIDTIVIPENTVVMGDGKYKSELLWSASTWEYGKLPETLISLTQNVEIKDLGLNGSRVKNCITTNGTDNENLYIHDVNIKFYRLSGQVTGGGGVTTTGEYTTSELLVMIKEESENGSLLKLNGKNVRLDHVLCDCDYNPGKQMEGNCSYLSVTNCSFTGGWSPVAVENACIFENNEYALGTLGLHGHNIYIAGCNLHDNKGNNRELFTLDGLPFASDLTVRAIGAAIADSQNAVANELSSEEIAAAGSVYDAIDPSLNKSYTRFYQLLNKSYAENALKGKTMLVTDGQGMGQLRRIVWNNASYVLIDSDFAVSPNRNSTVCINIPRDGWFFVNNRFHNGSASGIYGTMIDAVFDGNVFSEHSGQIFNVHQSPAWYLSVINEAIIEPYYTHGEGFGGVNASQTGTSRFTLLFQTAGFENSVRCFLFKHNSMYEGSNLNLQCNTSSPYAVCDVVIENNYVASGDVGIEASGSFAAIDGMLLYNNHFATTNAYSGEILTNLNSQNNVNTIGEARVRDLLATDIASLCCTVGVSSGTPLYGSVSGGRTVTAGSDITVCAVPDENCELIGWFDDGKLVSEEESFTFTVYNNMDLIAQFKPITVSVNFVTGKGGTITVDEQSVEDTDLLSDFALGAEIELSAQPDAGYRFAYWKDQTGAIVSGDPDVTFTAQNDMLLIAVFAKELPEGEYYIRFLDADGILKKICVTSQTVVPPVPEMEVGTTFVGYRVQGSSGSAIVSDYDDIEEDVFLIPVFETAG